MENILISCRVFHWKIYLGDWNLFQKGETFAEREKKEKKKKRGPCSQLRPRTHGRRNRAHNGGPCGGLYISTHHKARVFLPASLLRLSFPKAPKPPAPPPSSGSSSPPPWWVATSETEPHSFALLCSIRSVVWRDAALCFFFCVADHLQEEPPRDLQVPLPWWDSPPFFSSIRRLCTLCMCWSWLQASTWFGVAVGFRLLHSLDSNRADFDCIVCNCSFTMAVWGL